MLKLTDAKKNVPLHSHTSWLVGGSAEYFFEPASREELADVVRLCQSEGKRLTVIGGGSNVLVSDQGVKGVVASLSKLSGIEIIEDKTALRFWALAGTPKSQLLKTFLKYKLAPACFLAGLPGQVGGGIVMNAGVSEQLQPREFVDIIEAVEVMRPDGQFETIGAKDLEWKYRHCDGWQPGVISRALIRWPMQPDNDVLQKVKVLNQKRLQKQPLEWPSGGSVFRNPLPQTAGALIEKSGLKGHSIGGAQISEKHANFIINKGDAKASDIKALIELCQKTVHEKWGVDLLTEVIWLE